MRGFRHLAAVTTIAGLLAGAAATAASATTSRTAGAGAAAVRVRSGTTAVTTAPGGAAALLKHGIVPLATWPGTQSVVFANSGPAARFTFPVTGGRVTASPLDGKVHHAGGILFVNLKNGKDIKVSRFTIDLAHAGLTGIVN